MSNGGGGRAVRHLRGTFESYAARAFAALPACAQVLLSGRPPIKIDGQVLDPGIQLILAAAARLRQPPFHQQSVAEARATFRKRVTQASGKAPSVHTVHDLEIEGAAGPLRARHYVPFGVGARDPLLVYLHGGGFVVGDLDTHDVACRLLGSAMGAHVLAVEYRKAPEHPFPAAIEDAQAALDYAFVHGPELGAAPNRVAIGGDSSGATLAAVATWLAVREHKPAPEVTLLIYPGTDRAGQYFSHSLFANGFALSREDIRWFNDLYAPGADPYDPRVSPLRADDLSRMPPTILISAGFDPLRDEAPAYAEALRAAGNDVIELRFSGLIHGFVGLVGINPTSRQAVVRIARSAKNLLANL